MTVVIVISSLFTARLVRWQALEHDIYDDAAGNGSEYTVTYEAVRGEIFDRNGEPLAADLTGYRVVMNRLFIGEDDLNGIILRLVELSGECGEKWNDELPIVTDSGGGYRFTEGADDTDMIAGEYIAWLAEKYGCAGYSAEERRNIIGVRYTMEKKLFGRTRPYVFAEGISEKSMAVISERMSEVRGVSVEAFAVRTYLNGSAAPHIVGVTGLISQEEYNGLAENGYSYTDTIGKSGIESAFESELRGTPGKCVFKEDRNGDIEIVRTEPARPGNSVYLTIDLRLQQAAQKALKEAVEEANEYAAMVNDKNMGADCNGAAAVVIDVRDFSVLCAASCPSYDLSAYYDDYEKLVADKASPLFDRAFAGALAPGSTFKPLTACAALEEKKITAHTSIECNGVYTKDGMELWCMGYHGEQELDSAMADSCNVFFAETGRLAGIDALEKYAKRCGLGVKTGVEIYESAGTLAGPEFSRLTGSEWYPGQTAAAAIGQSDSQFTPLQLAAYCGTIANGGKRLKTHVVDHIEKYKSGVTTYRSEPETADDMGVSEKNLQEVREAMYAAAKSYSQLQEYPIEIAGKTGTAENGGSDHANFICFAPYDKPEIAVAVMVEHGAKSGIAVNAAKKILDEYFHTENSEG